MKEAAFVAGRQTTDPLPSRPELDGNQRTQIDAGRPAYQHDESNAIDEETDGSIVLKNPEVENASLSSLSRSENDSVTKLSETHKHDEESIRHHRYHSEHGIDNDTAPLDSEASSKDDVYQGLVKGKRAQSVFVCPSCNDNPIYQRPNIPRNCPHGARDKMKENRGSFYESLKELDKGSRESVYTSPSCITEEPRVEVRAVINVFKEHFGSV